MRSGAKHCCARVRLSNAARGNGRAWYCSGNAGNSRVLRRQGMAMLCVARARAQFSNTTLRYGEAMHGSVMQRHCVVKRGNGTVKFCIAAAKSCLEQRRLCIVVRIEYGDTSFLFTGDAEWDSEHDMIDVGVDLSADVLKVGHHGSDTSSSYVFLREVMPRYAVISVGEGNSYGHPAEETLSRLSDVGAEIYRTDLHGTIICRSDGQNITFQTEKSSSGSDRMSGFVSRPGDGDSVSGAGAPYIGNANSYKFHYASCSSVDQMKESNKVEFYSRDEAINAGYDPCKRCNP